MLPHEVLVKLDPDQKARGAAFHRQIYGQLRDAILNGRLRPSDRLPSTRDLAVQLGLARNTVARAYADLFAEGYLSGMVGSGTYVSTHILEMAQDRSPSSANASPVEPGGQSPTRDRGLSIWGNRVLIQAPLEPPSPGLAYDFALGTTDWETFPHALWLQLMRRAARQQAAELSRYGDPAGYLPLRQAIARHLALSRGGTASAEQVVIVTGSQQAIDLLTRLWVSPGQSVVVEDPGYLEAKQVLAAAGANLIPIPVDAEGLDTASLRQSGFNTAPRLVYVTPSHQFPTGVTLSLARRLDLLSWAARRDVLIVEDDYDSEFHYRDRPVESLQGLDHDGRVVYVGTFSTVLFPPFRVGFVVLPPALVEPFVRAKWLADRQTPTLEQLTLTDFIAEGHFAQHLRKARRLASVRRLALLAAIEEHLCNQVSPPIANTGLHLMLRFAPRPGETAAETEFEITRRAAEFGVGVYPASRYHMRTSAEPALLIGFAGMQVESIHEGIRRLAAAAEPTRPR